MADYFGTFFISKLPFCREKMEIINGVEKQCLVIPCDEAQMTRTRNGSWALKLQLSEVEVNSQMRTNSIRLGYRDNEEVEKAKRLGYFKSAKNLGYLYLSSYDKELKADYTNNMTPILCNGKLFLDSIQNDDIKTDPMTGRKYIDFSFRKTKVLDSFGNSHEVIVGDCESEHQIGVAKEIPIEHGEITTNPPTSDEQIITTHITDTKRDTNIPKEYGSFEW